VEAYSWSTIDINFTFTAISAYTKVKKKEKMKKVTILIAVVIFGMSLISTLSPYALAQLPTEKPSLDKDMEVVKNNEAIPTLSIPDKRPVGGIDLTLSPTFMNLLADPGKKVSAPIKIKNNGNETEYLEIRLAKFEASADGAAPKLIEIEKTDEFFSWISFSQQQFNLAPNQTKTITVSITPAKTAGLGYYYGVIFQRIQEKEAEQGEAIVTGAPAVSILLEVKSPHAKKELQLVDFSTDKLFYEYLPTSFNIKLKNTGNIHLVPGGDIFIDSLKTKQIAILPVNRSRGNVLPNSQRTYSVDWTDGMIVNIPDPAHKEIDSAKGTKKYKTTWDLSKGDKFRIGKYTAHALVVYDNGERDVPLEATVSFWVIPWKIVLAGLVVAIFAFVGIRSTLSSSIRKLRSGKK
jgi:hypothetical protein